MHNLGKKQVPQHGVHIMQLIWHLDEVLSIENILTLIF